MRRGLVTLGTSLMVLPPVVVLALVFIPFDAEITRSFYVLTPGPAAALFMLLGAGLLIAGLWQRRS